MHAASASDPVLPGVAHEFLQAGGKERLRPADVLFDLLHGLGQTSAPFFRVVWPLPLFFGQTRRIGGGKAAPRWTDSFSGTAKKAEMNSAIMT